MRYLIYIKYFANLINIQPHTDYGYFLTNYDYIPLYLENTKKYLNDTNI
jgi:hypothetical protein